MTTKCILFQAHSFVCPPIGESLVLASDESLVYFLWPQRQSAWVKKLAEKISWTPQKTTVLHEAEKQIKAYLAKEIKEFHIRYQLQGSPFQKKVWESLQKIPYGKTLSYQEFAQQNFSQKHTRAVSAQLGKNPLPLLFPCHRVIASDGRLYNFGGGLDLKEQFLLLERQSPSLLL